MYPGSRVLTLPESAGKPAPEKADYIEVIDKAGDQERKEYSPFSSPIFAPWLFTPVTRPCICIFRFLSFITFVGWRRGLIDVMQRETVRQRPAAVLQALAMEPFQNLVSPTDGFSEAL